MTHSLFARWMVAGLAGVLCLAGCSEPSVESAAAEPAQTDVIDVSGQWITEADGSIMQDPQPSGLTVWQGQLVSISDGSAQADQQRRLHMLNPATARLAPKTEEMRLGSRVRRSCFSNYLANKPDLEALVADPQQPGVFYTVTEDATRTGALSARCQKRYRQTGSTDYPTLLVRLEVTDDGSVYMSRVRPLQFDAALQVGDFPNDGIEGMALGADRTLYLALEKDMAGKPRIFSVQLDDSFWDSTDFAPVNEPPLQMPQWSGGNHPFNALAVYQPVVDQPGMLLAMARNDDELWILDLSAQQPARSIKMRFLAPEVGEDCPAYTAMDNASIEGLAVLGDTLYLVNDPWKVNYLKNVQCPATQARYAAMAPLLFATPLRSDWFDAAPVAKPAD